MAQPAQKQPQGQDRMKIVMLNKKEREPDKYGFNVSDMQKDDGNDLKDDKFADYNEMENDVDDYEGDDVHNPLLPKSNEKKDQLEQLVYKVKDNFEMPVLNMITEIRRCEQFAKDADEFMNISGEDNIFRSSCDWLVPPSDDPAKEKRKMVRAAIDSILMSIFNAQTEIHRTRAEQVTEYKYKYFSGWISDELRYIEMQICQVSQEIMKLLKDPTKPKTVRLNPRQLLRQQKDRKNEIPNLFFDYAKDNGNNLTYEDLLEYLKRCVFKAACSISTFNQTAHKNLKAIDAYLEELEYPIKAEDQQNVQNMGEEEEEEKQSEESDDDDVDADITDKTHDQQRDFQLRLCLAKQFNRIADRASRKEYAQQERDTRFLRQQQAIDSQISPALQRTLQENLHGLKAPSANIGRYLLIPFAKTADGLKNVEDEAIKKFLAPIEYHKIELELICSNFDKLLSYENFQTITSELDKSKVLRSVHIIIKIFYYLQEKLLKLNERELQQPEAGGAVAKNQKLEQPVVRLMQLLQGIKKWCEPDEAAQKLKEQAQISDELEDSKIEEVEKHNKKTKPEEEKQKTEAEKKAEQLAKNKQAEEKELARLFKIKVNKRKDSFDQTKLFILTQIWLDQLPKFFSFFANENIFGQKDLSNQPCMKAFCENIMTILKTEKKNDISIPSEKDFKYILSGYAEQGHIAQQLDQIFESKGFGFDDPDKEYEQMQNVPRTMLQQMIKIFDDSLVFSLSPFDQATLVKSFCQFMKDQIKDIRLREKRSTILKDFCKKVSGVGVDGQENKTEVDRNKEDLAVDGYKFLRAYFKWEGTIDRQILNLRLEQSDRQQYCTYKKQAKDILLQNSDMLIEWLFIMWEKRRVIQKKEETQNQVVEEIKRNEESKDKQPKDYSIVKKKLRLEETEEINTMLMFQILLNFNSKNIEMIIGTKSTKGVSEYKPSRKNLQKMLLLLQSKLKENVMFKEPLKKHCMIIRFDLLTKFCHNIREKLIAENETKPKVREYRPLFAYTWVIMLQNYIHKREYDLEMIGDDLVKDREKIYQDGAGKLMQEVIDFWHTIRAKVCKKVDDIKILVPSQSLSHELRDDYIPKLIEIAFKEYDGNCNTLTHLLQFLFYYHEITHTIEKQNPDDPKLIQMLPVLVKVSERYLKDRLVGDQRIQTEYQKFALDFDTWLYCGNNKCQECEKRQNRWTEINKQQVMVLSNSPILRRIQLAFNKLFDNDVYFKQKDKVLDGEEQFNMFQFKDDIESQFKQMEQQIFFKFQSDKQKWDGKEENELFYENDISKPKPLVRLIIPERVEKIDPSKHNDKKGVVWTKELKDKCEKTDFFDAKKIKDLLKEIIENPYKTGMGPDSQNNDLYDFIKKIRANQFLTKLPAVEDPLANEKDSCDTKRRWTAEYFECLKTCHNKDTDNDRKFIKPQWLTPQHFDRYQSSAEEGKISGQFWVWYELTVTLAYDIEKANKYHAKRMAFNVKAKRKDLIQEAFCKYALLKKKLDLNIYDNIEQLLKDTVEIQDLNRKIGQLKVIEGDPDEDKPDKTDNVFMKAEQPFVMHETLNWIKKRVEKKKNDKNFLRNFRLKETTLQIKEKLDNQGNDGESHNERQQRFNDAAQRISLEEIMNDESTLLTTNEEKLDFYGLLMQATGAKISDDAPGESDYLEFAKWKAWKVYSHLSENDAQIEYIAKVQSKIYDHSYQVSQVIEHLSTFSRGTGKKKKKLAFYPLEAFKQKQEQIGSLVKQNAGELRERNLSIDDEIKQANDYIDQMKDITSSISNFNENEDYENKSIAPMFCSYFHIQFWGRHFSPELTFNSDGFIIRRKYKADLPVLDFELRRLFPFLTRDPNKTRINSRESPFHKADTKEAREPKHDQEISLIAICFDIQPLNDQVINLYKGEDNEIANKIDLVKVQAAHNRLNFSTFFSQNYSRYFYTTTRKPNEEMKNQCDIILKAELKSWAQKDSEREDDGNLYISKQDFLQKVGKRIQTMIGEQDPSEIEKTWNKCAEEELKRLQRLNFMTEQNQADDVKKLPVEAEMPLKDGEEQKKQTGLFIYIKTKYIDINQFYYDSVLCILEVEKPFPTGFYFQRVKKQDTWKIVGARKTNDDLREHLTNYKQAIQDYRRSEESYKNLGKPNEESGNNDEAKKKHKEDALQELNKKAKKIYSNAKDQFIADVGGGLLATMNKFFPDNGLYQVSKDKEFLPREMAFKQEDRTGIELLRATPISSQDISSETRKAIFHEVLKIFMSLDEMLKQLQLCLDCMSDFFRDYHDFQNMTALGDITSSNIANFQTKQDNFVKQLEEIRKDHQIDQKLAEERDQMDVEQE